MKFYNMGSRPLEYPVYNGKALAIPAGAANVKIAFKQSHLKRWDPAAQKYVPMNVYIWKGKVVHA